MLFMAAGFVIWASDSDADDPIPPAPAAAPLLMAPQKPPTPPAALEKSREEKRFSRYDDNEDSIITRTETMGSRRGAWERLAATCRNCLALHACAFTTSATFDREDEESCCTLTVRPEKR